ncbi:hypothetical protein GCM10010236_06950 [Streptomyces eurythermus]|nr:hypothetical protein GCM10010236_06950 [Streptomyces eurythermus]
MAALRDARRGTGGRTGRRHPCRPVAHRARFLPDTEPEPAAGAEPLRIGDEYRRVPRNSLPTSG